MDWKRSPQCDMKMGSMHVDATLMQAIALFENAFMP